MPKKTTEVVGTRKDSREQVRLSKFFPDESDAFPVECRGCPKTVCDKRGKICPKEEVKPVAMFY